MNPMDPQWTKMTGLPPGVSHQQPAPKPVTTEPTAKIPRTSSSSNGNGCLVTIAIGALSLAGFSSAVSKIKSEYKYAADERLYLSQKTTAKEPSTVLGCSDAPVRLPSRAFQEPSTKQDELRKK